MNAIGQPISRIDGRLKVTGGAHYTSDIPIAGHRSRRYRPEHDCEWADDIDRHSRGGAGSRSVGGLYPSQYAAHEPDPKALEPFASPWAIVSSSSGRQDSVRRPADRVGCGHVARSGSICRHTDQGRLRNGTAGRLRSASARTMRFNRHNSYGRSPSSVGNADEAISASPFQIKQIYTTSDRHHNPMEPHATTAVWDANGRADPL